MKNIDEMLKDYNVANIDEKIQFELDKVICKEEKQAFSFKNIELCVSCMDFTTLKPTDTVASVEAFILDMLKKQKKNDMPACAAVCVFPNFAAIAHEALKNTNIHTAVVAAGFPASQTFMKIKQEECRMAIEAGADEVDVVISVGDILEGNYQKAHEELCQLREICKDVKLKVILETGELKTSENIFNAALTAMYAGVDFIKTSTGKVSVNATPDAVFVMCEAIKQFYKKEGRMVGIKIAGGVSKTQNAIQYHTIVSHILGEKWMNKNYFRIGTSQLLGNAIKDLQAMKLKES